VKIERDKSKTKNECKLTALLLNVVIFDHIAFTVQVRQEKLGFDFAKSDHKLFDETNCRGSTTQKVA
jgi:hypothetical protein